MTPAEMHVTALAGIPPRVRPGDDLAAFLLAALERSGDAVRDGDVVVVAQKIVSKAEGRLVRLADVVPSPRAAELAARTGKDPRAVEAILGESVAVLRAVPGVLIVETRHGLVLANAGADMSNVEHDEEDDHLLLLPEDPDASAARLRAALAARTAREAPGPGSEADAAFRPKAGTEAGAGTGTGGEAPGGRAAVPVGGTRPGAHAGVGAGRGRGPRIGVVVADSVGRAWREGTVGLAIGVSGLPARLDRRGEPDLFGRALHVTEVGIADAIASAASIVMGEGAEGRPAALVRGLSFDDRSEAERDGRARDLVRPRERDLFR